uniref:Succinyl-diaminopimelate desuccinylase n=1 Tax=uncultured SAR11 cluster alpha proteobacterium H17925_23J24 TaxID=715036 RepID=E7C9W4_9PROT|nr:acetylornithine deacetylase/succinyl-diaminopimelate desuccinylase [uncultured SAR11 cluster alpha proteobacterium H17925_23J24]
MQISELKLAKDLIRKPSITPKDAGAINLLAKNLRSIGFNCKIINFKNIKNLYAKLGKSSPNFCYAGHTDVVPPGNIKNWTINPFKPIVRNNKLIGRGANDMKASIACFVAAVSRFKNQNKNFKGSISLLITGDEEGMALNGTKRVVKYLKRKKEKINFCLVGEPTNPNKLGEMIKIGRRGSLTGRLTVIGSQGHVAYPHRANNPSNTLIKILKRIKDLKLDRGTKNFQPSNLEVTKINIDNHADNVIPGSAYAVFNIRFNDKHSSGSLKRKLNKIFKAVTKTNKSKFKVNYEVSGEAFLTKPNKITFMIQNTIKKITGIKPKLSTSGGTSDARFIKNIAPCLEFGLVGKTMHKIDESVSVSDLKKLTKIYENILVSYFK